MIECKRCLTTEVIIKRGFVRKKQRYYCKSCDYHFVQADQRQVYSPEAKALAILMYGMCKSSYGMIARLFNTSRTMVYYWIKEFGENLPEPTIAYYS